MSTFTHFLSPNPLSLQSSSSVISWLPTHHQRLHTHKKTHLKSSTSSVFLPKPTSETHFQESWVETLRSQAHSGLLLQAISTYNAMLMADILPDNFVFPAILKVAADLQDLNFGKQIHAHVVKFGYGSKSTTVDNTLVNMYGKCGDIRDVHKVFDKMSQRNQVSWNSIISALCGNHEWEDNFEPSSFTLVSIMSVCGNLGDPEELRLGKQVHAFSLRKGVNALAFH